MYAGQFEGTRANVYQLGRNAFERGSRTRQCHVDYACAGVSTKSTLIHISIVLMNG